MFTCPIAFMRVESIQWKILMKITHHSISCYFCYDRCAWYFRNKRITVNYVLYSFRISYIDYSSFFLFCKNIFKIINPENVIITSINMYMYFIFLLYILQKSDNYFLHALSISLSDTNTIYNLSISIGKSISTSSISHDAFYIRKEVFPIFFLYLFWVIYFPWKLPEIESSFTQKSTNNDWSCPWSSSSFINSDMIYFFHVFDFSQKLLFSKFSLLS